MNIKTLLIIVYLFILSGCASTQKDPSVPTGRIYGEVVNTAKIPDRCETRDNSTGRGLLGAALGVVVGNQVGDGSGKKLAQVAGVVAGYQIGKNTNNENDDLVVCKKRGWLITLSFKDNYGRERTIDRRYSSLRQIGDIVEFKL